MVQQMMQGNPQMAAMLQVLLICCYCVANVLLMCCYCVANVLLMQMAAMLQNPEFLRRLSDPNTMQQVLLLFF